MRFWKGWCVAKGGSAFEKVVGMERLVGVKQSLRLDGKKFDKSKRWTYRKQNATKRQFVACRQATSL